MNNSNPIPPDGPGEYLAGIYEVLKHQEEMLHELTLNTTALVQTLRQSDQLSAAFDEARGQMREQLSRAHAARLYLIDEMIRRLRGT